MKPVNVHIITQFQSQGLGIKIIKWKKQGSGNSYTLLNMDTLIHKQAPLKHLEAQCI